MPGTDDVFPLVKAGDPIRHESWNDFAEQLTRLGNIGDDMDIIATGAGTFRRTVKRSGGVRIIFEIVSYDILEGSATCHVIATLCNGKVPGIDEDGNVEVTDPTGCYFSNEDEVSLPGRKGWADLVMAYPADGVCFYACSALCCQGIL